MSRVSRSLPNTASLSQLQFLPDDAVLHPNQLASQTNFYQSVFLTNPTRRSQATTPFAQLWTRHRYSRTFRKLQLYPHTPTTATPTHPLTQTLTHLRTGRAGLRCDQKGSGQGNKPRARAPEGKARADAPFCLTRHHLLKVFLPIFFVVGLPKFV
jgi:hypothetical protein